MKKTSVISFLLSFCLLASCGGKLTVDSVNCNFAENPSGTASGDIRFGWTLSAGGEGDRQTAYEIVVSARKDFSDPVWSSGSVASPESRFVPYGGGALENGCRYWWKVRVWDRNGKASKWSSPAWFITALNDWDAEWIGAIRREDSRLPEGNRYHTPAAGAADNAAWDDVEPLAKRSIMLRRDFSVAGDAAGAVVSVCGLGHYDIWVNGCKVDNSVFKPLWSEYSKTIYYNTFDITPLLKKGMNTIGVILGNGMYNVAGGRYTKFRISYGPPTLLLQADISYNDGTKGRMVSDGSWKYAPSPVTFNCIFGGEDYDARLEQPGWSAPGFDDSGWIPAVVQEAPSGKLTPQSAPPVTVAEYYPVKEHKVLGPHRHLFDMGQNLSGFPAIKVRGRAGQKLRLRPAEQIDENGIRQGTSGSPCWFEYTLKGDGDEEWTPQFSYYGYRYLQVDGADYLTPEGGGEYPLILDLESCFAHSSAAAAGQFECSNELFNRIWFIIDKAMRSNMQAVFTDCPHREKLGWLEETHLNGPGLFFNYDLRTLIPKIMRDIADAQRPDGLIPDIAPEYVVFLEGFVDSPEWGSAGAILPWMYREWYGDDSLIRRYYPVMRRYTDYLSTKANGGILSYGLGDWCDYGPLQAGHSQNTPMEITATGHYYMVADYTAKAAALTGDKDGETKYRALAAEIAEAFNTRLFDPAASVYGSGSQCSYAIPLYLDIVPAQHKKAVLDNLVKAVEERGWKLSTGDVGNRYLYQALAKNNLNEIMYRMHNHRDLPGYGFQIDMGVTTLTEQWNPHLGLSWNHFMMGQIVEWFYSSLAGIRPDPENPGFSHFFIEPAAVGDLTWVKGSYDSILGLIESEWRIEGDVCTIRVRIPVNSTATLVMPFGDRTPKKLGSGEYRFSARVE